MLKLALFLASRQSLESGNLAINYRRKPRSLRKVLDTDYRELSKEEQRDIGKLLVVRENPLESPEEFMNSDFDKKMPQIFIYQTDGNDKYLIDTQGYNYARYVTRLVNM